MTVVDALRKAQSHLDTAMSFSIIYVDSNVFHEESLTPTQNSKIVWESQYL